MTSTTENMDVKDELGVSIPQPPPDDTHDRGWPMTGLAALAVGAGSAVVAAILRKRRSTSSRLARLLPGR